MKIPSVGVNVDIYNAVKANAAHTGKTAVQSSSRVRTDGVSISSEAKFLYDRADGNNNTYRK